jgi:hypothetical protein
MKVWSIKAGGDLCGGMAIVAADDVELAVSLAVKIPCDIWRVEWHKPDECRLLEATAEGDPRVLDYFEHGE